MVCDYLIVIPEIRVRSEELDSIDDVYNQRKRVKGNVLYLEPREARLD